VIVLSAAPQTARPSWDFPRSTFGALILVELAQEHGGRAQAALAATGLEPSDLARPDLEIAAGQELTVVRNMLRLLGDTPGLGARAGSRITLGMAGLWGFAMLNSATTREAIEIALRYGYGHFSFVFARPRVALRRHECHIVLDTSELPVDVRDFLIERDLAAQVTLIPQLLGPDVRVRVETSLATDRARALAAVLRSNDVVGGSPRDSVVLPAGVLDRRLPMADPHALARWKQQCEALLARHANLPPGVGVIGAVRAAILRDPAHPPTLDDVARGLSISVRTLRRQLAQAQTSFRSIGDDVRRAVADELLKRGDTVSNVALHLGYADTPTFIRAYRRWTGRTPGTTARDT